MSTNQPAGPSISPRDPAAAAADRRARAYREAIQKAAGGPAEEQTREAALRHGLQVCRITWEDTGRFKGSAVGPNISDMTIQVRHPAARGGGTETTCMPVIRFPNFSDVTGDIAPERFNLLVGNERGGPLRRITLRELLTDLRSFLSRPESWAGERTSLLAPERDSHVLVSAQACLLPVPREGIAEFTPALFNYQSEPGNPAVLAILATREGTSITVIDNQRDTFSEGGAWGQQLYFNQNGERAVFTGERKSDFLAEAARAAAQAGEPAPEADDREGLNLVLLIQVPLKQREQRLRRDVIQFFSEPAEGALCYAAAPPDIEEAVIGHGEVEGPYTEIDGLAMERDPRFPIRVTVQFYQATSTGLVDEAAMAQIAEQINRVYQEADYVGSLVLGESDRPTEHDGPKLEPPAWWNRFWKRYYANTGRTREEALAELAKLLGRPPAADDEEAARALLVGEAD